MLEKFASWVKKRQASPHKSEGASKKKKKEKKEPVVHHDIDNWLTSVDNLKKELAKLKAAFDANKQKKVKPKQETKPSTDVTKKPEPKSVQAKKDEPKDTSKKDDKDLKDEDQPDRLPVDNSNKFRN